MAVDSPQIRIDPYTSTVPLVQIPQEDLAAPPPAQRLYSRKAGLAEIGDDVFRGMMRGLQLKEQRKYAQAEATTAALDKQTSDAYDNYQRALATGKKDESDAAYGVYLKTFNDAKQAKAQFAIPEKKPKDKGGKGKKDEGGAATGGFGAGLKQFFERNPHIIPELSLLAMQPKPPGPSTETIRTQQEIKAADTQQQIEEQRKAEGDRKASAAKVYDDLGKIPEEKLTPEQAQNLDWAKSVLYPEKFTGRFFIYKSPDGSHEEAFHPGTEPPGWTIADKASSGQKLGSVGDFIATVAKDNKINDDKLNAGQKGYLEKLWHFYQLNPSASENSSWYLDKNSNWEIRTAPGYRGPVPPKPDPGLFPPNFVLPGSRPSQATGGMTPPPAQGTPQAASKAGGGISQPPKAGAAPRQAAAPQAAPQPRMGRPPLPSWQGTTNTQKVETEKNDRNAKARAAYDKAVQFARKNAKGKDQLTSALQEAQGELWKNMLETEKWYAQQIRSVGGTYQGSWTTPDGKKTYYFDTPEQLVNFMREASPVQ